MTLDSRKPFIYGHHERQSLSDLQMDLQLGEAGYAVQEGSWVYKTYNGDFVTFQISSTTSAAPTLESIGTAGSILKYITNDIVGNSLLSESGNTVSVSGNFKIPNLEQNALIFTGPGKQLSATSNVTYNGVTFSVGKAGYFATTLEVDGLITADGGINLTGGTISVGRIGYSSTDGVFIRANTGASNDFVLYSQDTGALLVNPTGTRNLQVGHSSGLTTLPGAVFATSTLNVSGLASFRSGITLANLAGTMGIIRDVSNSYNVIAGGNLSNDGANLLMYGSTHATLAGDFYLRDGSSTIISYDKSAATIGFSPSVFMGSTLNVSGVSNHSQNMFIDRAGLGIWLNAPGTFSNGMYLNGSSLAFRSGGSTDRLVITSTGGSTFTSTLNVSGAVSMASTLAVAGAITATNAAFSINDNEATPWEVYQGSNVYLRVRTSNGTEVVTIGNSSTNPAVNFPSNGIHTFTGPVVLSSTLAVTGTSIFSNDMNLSRANSGNTSTFTLENTSNTANSHARHLIRTPLSGGDPYISFNRNGDNTYSIGYDVSHGRLVISNSTSLGSGNILTASVSNLDILTAFSVSGTSTLSSTLTVSGTTTITKSNSNASGLLLTSTTAGNGLTIGGDTNLYRSAANTLKTDDAFTVLGAFTGSGDWIFTQSSHTIRGNSSDGSDNKHLWIQAAGGSGRGAEIILTGDDSPGYDGTMYLQAGTTSASHIVFTTAGQLRGRVAGDGKFIIGDYAALNADVSNHPLMGVAGEFGAGGDIFYESDVPSGGQDFPIVPGITPYYLKIKVWNGSTWDKKWLKLYENDVA